jgi:dihydrofolate reductase
MAQLTVTTFLSLDGVMQSPGGPSEDPSDGFDLGGWLVPFVDDDMNRQVTTWISGAGSFLLGRRTYEIFASFWPTVTDQNDPVASRLNGLQKYVASKTLDHLDWANSTLIGDGLVDAVTALKAGLGGEIQVHGSGNLATTLFEHDLVDEYRLMIYPIVLGRGQKLFVDGSTPKSFELVSATTTAAGVTIQTLRPAGAVTIGSFLSE